MVPIPIFIMFGAAAFWLMIYTFIDDKNRLYANIATGLSAGILFHYLGALVAGEAVTDLTEGQSIMAVCYFLGVVMYVYTVLYIIEIIIMYVNNKKARASEAEESML